jgi:hypothetical protein
MPRQQRRNRIIRPERIKTKNWIGQARDLAQQANTERTPPGEETEVAKEPEEAPSPPTWRQQAGFSLFFDYVTDEHGRQRWRTRVYHEESGEAPELPGIETAEWVNWILERAKLPVAAEPVRPEIEAAAPPAPVASYDARIEILDVQVSEIGPSPGVPEKRLMAEVRFQVSGTDAEALTADCIPFRIEVHTVDLESGASNLVASKQSQLQPQVFEYPSQQTFLVPEAGRHELHSIVLLLPPGEMMASHRGPIIRVVP